MTWATTPTERRSRLVQVTTSRMLHKARCMPGHGDSRLGSNGAQRAEVVGSQDTFIAGMRLRRRVGVTVEGGREEGGF